MYSNVVDRKIIKLIQFRRGMSMDLTYSKVRNIWGKRVIQDMSNDILNMLVRSGKEDRSSIVLNKIEIANRNISFFKVFNWVKYIGISGSIAAGFAKENDDIDIYIVVKDYTAWIYRGILTLKNIFKHVMRTNRDGENVKDLFCVNFISEERGLCIDNDIFNFHELMFNIPISENGEEYLKYIYKCNPWLIDEYMIKKDWVYTRIRREKKAGALLRFVNRSAYIAQIVFMVLASHRPELTNIVQLYKKGRIEFFSKDFKSRVLNGV